jgi:hypothetical protein
MPDRKTPPRNLRKLSFRTAYVLAFLFIGIALGLMLVHRPSTPTEFQVQSPAGANLGPGHSHAGAILESKETKPSMSSPGDQKADYSEPSIHHNARRIRENSLVSLISESTGITPEDIPPTLSIQDFAAQVAAIATKDIWTAREGGSLPEDSTVTDVRFGTSPRPPEPPASPRTRFSTFDTRIFAVFDTSAYAYPSVLLKWWRVDRPELIVLQKCEIDPHAASNYVWYNNKDGWPNGQYRVEVYSLGESFRMMSSGQYEVSEN